MNPTDCAISDILHPLMPQNTTTLRTTPQLSKERGKGKGTGPYEGWFKPPMFEMLNNSLTMGDRMFKLSRLGRG